MLIFALEKGGIILVSEELLLSIGKQTLLRSLHGDNRFSKISWPIYHYI